MTTQKFAGSLTDTPALERHLARLGFAPEAASAKARMFAVNAAALDAAGAGGADKRAYYVPGRVEVLGKHTDYAGGSTMVAAVERGVCMVAAGRGDRAVSVLDTAREKSVLFELDPELTPAAGHWSNYPMTVARRIARNFPGAVRGADIAFASDLPSAAGMSSSSAIMIAAFHALADANGVWEHERFPAELNDRLQLAGYLGCVENGQSFGELAGDRGVGTFGGSEDHTAILCSRPGHVNEYSYCPVRFARSIKVPEGLTFVIGSSAVAARKTGAALEKYNRASRLAGRLVELWREATGRDDPHLAAVLASSADAVEEMEAVIRRAGAEGESEDLLDRMRHFFHENNTVIPRAAEALGRGDLEAFGEIVDSSQEAAERLLRNQVPETSYLAASARRCGALAASAFGAGFGGSVWALVERERAGRFVAEWGDGYRAAYPEHAEGAEFFVTGAGRPMFRLQ